MLWTDSPRRRRFHISMASAFVTGGEVGAERGIFDRLVAHFLALSGCSAPALSTVGADAAGELNGVSDITCLSVREAACQAHENSYVYGAVAASRAALAAVIRLRKAALAGAAFFAWPLYDGVRKLRFQVGFCGLRLPIDPPMPTTGKDATNGCVLRSLSWLGGHIEAGPWKVMAHEHKRLPPSQRLLHVGC
jgi:peptidoglycan/xylan/chitin deacetylase (PgdA/CDA1 family)